MKKVIITSCLAILLLMSFATAVSSVHEIRYDQYDAENAPDAGDSYNKQATTSKGTYNKTLHILGTLVLILLIIIILKWILSKGPFKKARKSSVPPKKSTKRKRSKK